MLLVRKDMEISERNQKKIGKIFRVWSKVILERRMVLFQVKNSETGLLIGIVEKKMKFLEKNWEFKDLWMVVL